MNRIANVAGICLLSVWGVVTPLQGGAIRSVTLANTLEANDDGSTSAVNLGIDGEGGVNFFGQNFTQIYVNNNGNLTFESPFGTFTPRGLATGVGRPIIAPFFADVYTEGDSGLVMYGNAVINDVNAFVANYVNVCYFSACDKHNSFQVVLYDRSNTGAGNFDIEFNYDQVQWETGSDSGGRDGLGGTSAAVGYSNGLSGDANVYYQLPGSIVNGALVNGGPDALISNSNTGVPGRYVFSVRNGVVSQGLMITSGPPPAAGALGVPYGPFTATASGGSGTFQWSASGVPGISIDSATGILSGTPTAAGAFSLMVTVADANNLTQTTSQSYPVTVVSAPLMITNAAPPANGAVGSAYSFPLAASGGSGVFLWSVSGVPGVTVNGATGVLGGAPTVGGNLTLTVTLTNANVPGQSISQNYPVNVLGITSGAPPASGTVGMPYGPFTATAAGGSGSYLWSASGIAGVTINGATGVLSGAPTMPGLGMMLAVTVTDTTTHLTATQNYPVDIAGSALMITNTSLPGGIQNQPYSARLVGAGGSGSLYLVDQRDRWACGELFQWRNQRKPLWRWKPHAERDPGRRRESFGDACYEAVYDRRSLSAPSASRVREHWEVSRQARLYRQRSPRAAEVRATHGPRRACPRH